ncbi:thioredoxin family protein [Flavobacterium amniphilum]|uniref:thioredoxin family protein n=1 Tax=Flavobacterium amniphilum TaxID=1834035 RepID=UPI00202A2E0F|nr:thioredoxin family protein [Flavobacterium amniphilum]MCL9804763.1 thioredoxin family protein [Flavobacterium amniphilum]
MRRSVTAALIAALALTACTSQQIMPLRGGTPIAMDKRAVIQEPQKPAETFLLGLKTKSDLEAAPYDSWFKPGEEAYKSNPSVITLLRNAPQDYQISIFMGTWCDDSKAQVPNFYKILGEIDFDLSKVKLITMDREKKTPENFEEGLNITNVPTFIFYKNGKELHRIVESPVETLEADMLKIISEEPYKHTYQN